MTVHRFLVSGTDGELFDFHLPVCMLLNGIERRGQTVLYTCMAEHREYALEIAHKAGVTMQEWQDESWKTLIEGSAGIVWEPLTYTCGRRGCHGMTKRGGTERHCAQQAIVWDTDGRGWCYYHNPENPKRFGQGYYDKSRNSRE